MKYVDKFNEKTISCGLKTKCAGNTVHFVDEIDSTNTWIKKLAAEGAEHGTLAAANLQTQGKGRLGRRWSAPKGSSIAMSLLLKPEFSTEKASMLTLVMGLSAARCAKNHHLEAGIKWPNDVVVNGKKICGILTEMGASDGKIDHIIVGTGINVNVKEFPEELKNTATSFFLETGKEFSRNEILTETIALFEEYYEKFLQTLDLTLLKEEYEALLVNKDQIVRVLDPLGEYQGIARGITEYGALLVETEDGTIQEISSGEVSVRGVYGYV